RAEWTGRIWITGDGDEIAESLKDYVNSLTTPFLLEWHRPPAQPWDCKRVAQFLPGRFSFAGFFPAKQDGAEPFSLIIARDELFLCVDPGKIDTGWLGAEVADKIHVQVKHLRPKVRNLLVADPFFAGHISAGDQPLFPRVVPMRLAPHAAHHPVWIKCEIADCVDSLFFCLEVFCDRRRMTA